METAYRFGPEWGEAASAFRFPFSRVRFYGLKEQQRSGLRDSYAEFCESEPGTQGYTPAQLDNSGDDLNARVCRLERLAPVDSGKMVKRGVYTMHLQEKDRRVTIEGFHFAASIDWNHGASEATIGVQEESELAQRLVVENFLRVYCAYRAVFMGGALLHSAGFEYNDLVLVCVGNSGTGKSTLSRKVFDHGGRVFSDDMNLLLPGPDGFRLHPVPFTGDFRRPLSHSDQAPVRPDAIVLLEQDSVLDAERVKGATAMSRVFANAPFVNQGETMYPRLFENLSAVLGSIPVIRLRSRRTDSADAIVAAVKSALRLQDQDNA